MTPAPLLSRLPSVRGKLIPNAPLKDLAWFGVGGPAEVLFKPADAEDLADFLKKKPADVPLTLLGAGSNTLIRDGGVPGVVVKLGPAFAKIEAQGTIISAGAAAMDLNIARAAHKAGLAGLEFLSGIPGSLGGALRMNAGAYGGETKDVLVDVLVADPRAGLRTVAAEALEMGYRSCRAPEDWVFVSARLRGAPDDPAAIEARMKAIRDKRETSQPVHERTSGSTFANPDGRKAWELIEAAGCRGLRVGGAMMSTQHCNFMINTANATAADLEALGEQVRARVLATSGIDLRWEVRRIGVPLPPGLPSPDTETPP